MPAETPYDLRFQLLGIPVRVHPMFWLASVVLGSSSGDPSAILIWVACVFVSILVHEFGHGLMARLLGYPAAIVLYTMGGLCYSQSERQGPWQRLAVLISGPGAGFLLAVPFVYFWLASDGNDLSPVGHRVAAYMVFINLFWGLVNLLPIWPLDGGQMTGVVLTMINRPKGMVWAYTISLVTAGLVGLLCMIKLQDLFLTLFFGLFALTNYQALHAAHERSKYGLDDDNDDWWRR
ncbi:MAG: site-2 protease family protein [Isosphaeraceae bacterium]|nr:site-2 protease family protein [Isosphaeraceae bacterium]